MKLKGLNNRQVRKINKSILLSLLYKNKIATKSTLARLSQLSIPAITNILQEMIKEGKVTHLNKTIYRRGISGGCYKISTKDGYTLCLNISSFIIESILVDELINPISELKTTCVTVQSVEQLLHEIENIYNLYHIEYQQQTIRLAIAIDGQVNPKSGTLLYFPQAICKTPFEIKYLLEKKLSTRLLIDHQHAMLALAEKWINQNNTPDYCVMNIDYNIGCAFVINQNIFCGSVFANGQIGHTVIMKNGEHCYCGRQGCLETIASLSSIKKQVSQLIKILSPTYFEHNTLTTKWIAEQYHNGNFEIQTIVTMAAKEIGLTLDNLINILNINKIYLYGQSCHFGQPWLDTIAEQISNPFDQPKQTQISFGQLSRSQQVMGIAYLYIEQQLTEN